MWFILSLMAALSGLMASEAGYAQPTGLPFAASSADQLEELSRIELERRITDGLYKKNVVYLDSELGPDDKSGIAPVLRTEAFFDDVETGGMLLSEVTAWIEDCVLVQRLEHTHQSDQGWWRIETRTDLSYLETEPERVEVRPRSDHPDYEKLGAAVRFDYRQEISARLRRVSERSSQLMEDAFAHFPADIPGRLLWLSRKYPQELNDDIYLRAGDLTFYQGGIEIAAPDGWLERVWYVDPGVSSDFPRWVHLFRTRYCNA